MKTKPGLSELGRSFTELLPVLNNKPGINTRIALVSNSPVSVARLSVQCPGDDRDVGLQAGKVHGLVYKYAPFLLCWTLRIITYPISHLRAIHYMCERVSLRFPQSVHRLSLSLGFYNSEALSFGDDRIMSKANWSLLVIMLMNILFHSLGDCDKLCHIRCKTLHIIKATEVGKMNTYCLCRMDPTTLLIHVYSQ